MGAPMAVNLSKALTATDTLHVYDSHTPTLDAFAHSCPTAKICRSSIDCVIASETIMTMLPNTTHVQSVFSPFLDGLDEHEKRERSLHIKGKLFIDSSTISPSATKVLSDQLKKYDSHFIDAPVSGGVIGAQAGTLTFMISYSPSLSSSIPFQTLERLLKRMGKRIIVCGEDAGAGLAAKLANNYALALNNLATCDTMILGMKLGLDPQILSQVLNTSTGRSWPSESNNPVPGIIKGAPAERNYEGGFGVGLMRKDLELALEAVRDAIGIADEMTSTSMTIGGLSSLGKAALNLYKEVEASEKYCKKDFSVVYQYLRDKSAMIDE